MTLVAELPVVYLDALVSQVSTADYAVINRNPEAGYDDAPVDAPVVFDLWTFGPTVDLLALGAVLRLNGVIVYDALGGGFQPGWAIDSIIQSPAANVRRFVVSPDSGLLDSLLVVTVLLDLPLAAPPASFTWTFTVEDRIAPRILTLEPRAINIVRVAFSESVLMSTALAPSNYAFAGASVAIPCVPAVGLRVAQVAASVVEVTTSTELTFGELYELAIVSVLDLHGNVILPPYDRAVFTSVRPVQPARRRFDLWRMVPEKNRREDYGDLRKFIRVLQDVADLLLYEIDRFADWLDVDYAPERSVDAMLEDLGNPFADLALSLSVAEKRRLARVLVDIYREKGTAPGVVNVVRFFLGITVSVIPYLGTYGMSLGESLLGFDWELGIGTAAGRYAFDVSSMVVLTDEQRARIRRIVNYMKPAHTHFINLLEPTTPVVVDHVQLGDSELGSDGTDGTWVLH